MAWHASSKKGAQKCTTAAYPVLLSSQEAAIREVFEAMDLDDNKLISYSVNAVVCAPPTTSCEVYAGFLHAQGYQEWLAATIGPKVLESDAWQQDAACRLSSSRAHCLADLS